MKLYKVQMDLSLVIARLTKFKTGVYNSSCPIVFVEAPDPDEACYKAMYNLMRKIVGQDPTNETLKLCKDLVHDIRITKVYVP